MTAPLGPQREDAGFDRVAYRHVLGEAAAGDLRPPIPSTSGMSGYNISQLI